MSYRILSLDGFGVWALIEVKALIALYDETTTGHQVLHDFDLIAGNSGGSIVLGALVADLSLGEILLLFKSQKIRNDIFSLSSLCNVAIHSATEVISAISPRLDVSGIAPKYSTEHKFNALRRVLQAPNGLLTGDVALSEVAKGIRNHSGENGDVHLLITAFDYDLDRAVFFRSSAIKNVPQWGESSASEITLAQAVHASSTAPVSYFDKPAEFDNHLARYWDGAIAGVNNPVLAAVTEAVGKKQDPTTVAVLSIGTATLDLPPSKPGAPSSPLTKPLDEPGIITDLQKLAKAIIDDPPDIATFLAHVMTGLCAGPNIRKSTHADSRVVRMNPRITPEGLSSPSLTSQQRRVLAARDLDAIQPAQVDAIEKYAELWLADKALNQPIRVSGKTREKELGQDLFSEAKAAWEAIR